MGETRSIIEFNFISVKEAAEKAGVTERWIQQLCKDGKIEGAMRLGGTGPWLIPRIWTKSQTTQKNEEKLYE